MILRDTDYIDEETFRGLSVAVVELIKMLIATVKTTQSRNHIVPCSPFLFTIYCSLFTISCSLS